MQDSLILSLVVAVWLSTLAIGFKPLLKYESTPGNFQVAAAHWPQATGLEQPRRTTLLMFVHPKCPCSRASIDQLALLSGRVGSAFRALVIFEKPVDTDKSWNRSALQEAARTIPGVTIVLDRNQVEARRFGVTTSGETFVYGADGALRYQGGITAGRGHAGECDGVDQVIALFKSFQSVPVVRAQSFGCALFNN